MSWICDGVPKDGKAYPNATGPHEPYENFGATCVMCNLPQEALATTQKRSMLPIVIAASSAVALLVVGGGICWISKSCPPPPPPPIPTTSASASALPGSTPVPTLSSTTTVGPSPGEIIPPDQIRTSAPKEIQDGIDDGTGSVIIPPVQDNDGLVAPGLESGQSSVPTSNILGNLELNHRETTIFSHSNLAVLGLSTFNFKTTPQNNIYAQLATKADMQVCRNYAGSHSYKAAVQCYESLRQRSPRDPVVLIHLNNAKALDPSSYSHTGFGNIHRIAVVVPIAGDEANPYYQQNLNTMYEILRGVAQAQNDYNNKHPNAFLFVLFINDYQNVEEAEQVARFLIDPSLGILGVLGYGPNDAVFRAVAPIYRDNNLALVSPLNTRVTPYASSQSMLRSSQTGLPDPDNIVEVYTNRSAEAIAKYIAGKDSYHPVALFEDTANPYSVGMSARLAQELNQYSLRLLTPAVNVNLNPNFRREVSAALGNQAKFAILNLGHNRIADAIEIANENYVQRPESLSLVAVDALYSPDLLVGAKEAVKSLIVAVPWSFETSTIFGRTAQELWQGRINWRTALAYDGTKALLQAFDTQGADKARIFRAVQDGIVVNESATRSSIFTKVPIMEALGKGQKPAGALYGFVQIN